MEPQTQSQSLDFTSTVDTSRPFRSVKEAVAVFGERLLVGEIYSSPSPSTTVKPPKRENSWRFTPSPVVMKSDHDQNGVGDNYNDQRYDNNGLLETLKKLEAELEETKEELKLLKERETETEVALATLNAELHKNMSKLARAEAAVAGKAAAKTVRFDDQRDNNNNNNNGEIMRVEEEKKKRETLAQILSVGLGDKESYYLGGKVRERKMKKKMKPIIPLVGDLFSKKKGTPANHHNPLYASPFFYD